MTHTGCSWRWGTEMSATATIIDPFTGCAWTLPVAVPVSARLDLADVEYSADAREWLGITLRRRSLRDEA
jgi:hypothetical protein